MLYRVDFAADRFDPYPPIESMAEVEADSPLDAAEAALRVAQGPLIGASRLWARVVVAVLPNGNVRTMCFPLTREATIPVGWLVDGLP